MVITSTSPLSRRPKELCCLPANNESTQTGVSGEHLITSACSLLFFFGQLAQRHILLCAKNEQIRLSRRSGADTTCAFLISFFFSSITRTPRVLQTPTHFKASPEGGEHPGWPACLPSLVLSSSPPPLSFYTWPEPATPFYFHRAQDLCYILPGCLATYFLFPSQFLPAHAMTCRWADEFPLVTP